MRRRHPPLGRDDAPADFRRESAGLKVVVNAVFEFPHPQRSQEKSRSHEGMGRFLRRPVRGHRGRLHFPCAGLRFSSARFAAGRDVDRESVLGRQTFIAAASLARHPKTVWKLVPRTTIDA